MDGGWWVCCCSGVGRQQDAEAGIQPRGTGAPLVLEPWICRSLPARLGLVGSGRTAPSLWLYAHGPPRPGTGPDS